MIKKLLLIDFKLRFKNIFFIFLIYNLIMDKLI